MMKTIPRYAPEFPLPPYSYVSGHWPHPLREPTGHSFGKQHATLVLPQQADWARCREYCYAIDLFNAGYYWEAHEQWEALWHAADRVGPTADFFKALIKLAAAGVKAREGNPEGMLRHVTRALQLLKPVFLLTQQNTLDAERYWGLEWRQLFELADQIRQILTRLPNHVTEKQPVLRVWDCCLELA
jgi:uncharacterized protein